MVPSSNSRSTDSTSRSAAIADRTEAKRRAIVAAAARAFRSLGYHATGMRDIAREAGLTAPNLYYYFRSKDELLFFCQKAALDRMLEACRRIEQGPASPADKLREVIAVHLEAMLDSVDGATAHLEIDALPREMRDPVVKLRDRYERGVRRIVAAGVKTGEFADCDVTLITRALLGALNWTARWYRHDGPTRQPHLVRAYADYLIRGLLAGGAKGTRS